MGRVFSSRLLLALPHFLWRSRWFWGAWLLIFLLPLTREEARLHFVGSRFYSNVYGQPWQERWMANEEATMSGLTPLERSLWKRVRDDGNFNSYYSGQNSDPSSTSAGHMLREFPREKWLRALALRQAVGWGSINSHAPLIKWAREGERKDPRNAFYPLILAKVLGDGGRGQEREAALERAANCTHFDDGISTLRKTVLRTARKAGVSTWGEEWEVWSNLDYRWSASSNQLEQLSVQLTNVSYNEVAVARKSKSPAKVRSALKRSNAMMRVSLLLQSSPCGSNMWRLGAKWTRNAWGIGRAGAAVGSPPEPTAAEFIAFASRQNSAPNVRLAQKCAARLRLLSSFTNSDPGLQSGAMFSMPEAFWAQIISPLGFGVLGFGFHLLCWWWFISLFSWGAKGHESSRQARVIPAAVVIGWALACFGVLFVMFLTWMNSPTTARRGPPAGQLEVTAAWGFFMFFAPPLLLALWCAIRAQRKNRDVLALPAREQLEMNLSPLDAFMLGRAAGIFALMLLAVCIGFTLLWGVLRWNGLSGYDWLRFIWPNISTRAIDPALTSLDSPATPIYAALCVIGLTLIWLGSWRYATDPQRRPVFHDGLRAWKEAIGCALVLTVWVYMALLLVGHFSGTAFSKRLDVVAARGEGAFVRGF